MSSKLDGKYANEGKLTAFNCAPRKSTGNLPKERKEMILPFGGSFNTFQNTTTSGTKIGVLEFCV
jgi:hypothetical protein